VNTANKFLDKKQSVQVFIKTMLLEKFRDDNIGY